MVLSASVAPSRRVLLVAASVVVTSLGVFTLIAEDLLHGGGLVSHDQPVLTWFVDHRTDWMVSVARFVSAVGGFVSLLCAGAVLGLWVWRHGWALGIAVAPEVSLLLAGLASSVAKAAFGRDRPPITVHKSYVTSPAFPSGHATSAAGFFLAAAFVLAITVAHQRRHQLVSIGTGLFFAALVGLSRLVLGVHWPSDVVAGWALGSAIAITTVVCVWWATTRIRTPRRTA